MADRAAPNHVRKTLSGWEPVSAAAREFHAKTKLGQVVDVRSRRPRNPGHHRKLFALLALVVDNTELFANTDDALVGLKAVMGRGRWERIKGTTKDMFYPESIAFDAMSQDDFEPFYDAALAAVQRWWLPVADNDLREAVEAFAA
jgi:hypothetical protein